MKKQHITLFFLFLFLSSTATAQFKKPIVSPRDQVQSREAKWNVGILGGGNLTTWLHFHSHEASNWYLKNYKVFDTLPNSLGYFGGICVERKLKNNISVGLNVVYAQHGIQLGFMDDHFPIEWDAEHNTIVFGQIKKSFKAKYRTIEAYIPVTYYIGLADKNNITPYVYVAPRISYVLPDTTATMNYSNFYYDAQGKIIENLSYSNSILYNQSTYRRLNVGATVGVGSRFRINTGNYYFLVKLDLSANFNGIPTYKDGEIDNDEFKKFRFSTDAHATLTVLLPIKKQLQGACMRWGEYD